MGRLENEDWYEWITNDQYWYDDTQMKYGIVWIINLPWPAQERLFEDSKPWQDKDLKMEDSINGSADQTQTLLHYTVYALSRTRMEILKFFGNWIVIFIIDYFMKFLHF